MADEANEGDEESDQDSSDESKQSKMKKNRFWARRKVGGKDIRRAEAAARKHAERRKEVLEEADECLAALGDPFESMDYDTKKHLGLYFYYTASKEEDRPVSEYAEYAADVVKVSPNTIINWINGFRDSKEIGKSCF